MDPKQFPLGPNEPITVVYKYLHIYFGPLGTALFNVLNIFGIKCRPVALILVTILRRSVLTEIT